MEIYDDIQEAVEGHFRQLGKKLTAEEVEIQVDRIKNEIEDDLRSQISYYARRILNGKNNYARIIKPDLEFKFLAGNQIKLVAVDRDELFQWGNENQTFGGGTPTAGLVYQEIGVGGNRATENNLHHPETWKWIDEWMRKGFKAENLIE